MILRAPRRPARPLASPAHERCLQRGLWLFPLILLLQLSWTSPSARKHPPLDRIFFPRFRRRSGSMAEKQFRKALEGPGSCATRNRPAGSKEALYSLSLLPALLWAVQALTFARTSARKLVKAKESAPLR